jgi:Na+-transporting methylmalonyl-CoA/oxaloacetate decarboxylase gamma subunit
MGIHDMYPVTVMGLGDLIPILFIIVFFVLPLLGKIAEAFKEKPKPKERPLTSETAKEYLKRMRGNQKARSPQYHAPATRPGGKAGHQSPQLAIHDVNFMLDPENQDVIKIMKAQMAKAQEEEAEEADIVVEPEKISFSAPLTEQQAMTGVVTEARGFVSMQQSLVPASGIPAAPKQDTAKKFALPGRRDAIRTRILEAGNLNDMQKAIVLKAILDKPKTLNLGENW